jgi:FAD/FMN-containing dehydrogenase/Fe-S oxidoreductase
VTTTAWDEIRAAVRGDVHADDVSRALYATDASIYQIAPTGVVIPHDEADVAAVLRIARRHGMSVLPRGGGTSLAGQTVGKAIQLDFSKYMRRVLEVNLEERYAWVEPGLVLDELNKHLAPHGLKFAPDVSPSNRATIGGMIGNNSSGMYSLKYGKTSDHVLALRIMLSDGTITTVEAIDDEQLRTKLTLDSLEGRAYRTVRRLGREHADEIERRFPKLLRRVGGYNLDSFHKPDRPFDLSRLIIGSEGTLAIVLAAKVRLVPRPKHTAIGVLAFESLEVALDAVIPCLECQPAAVELMDEILLDLTRSSRDYARYLAQFVQGTPGGLLQVEFFGDTAEAVQADLDRLEHHLRHNHEIDFDFTRAITPEQQRAVLQVRKASMPLLQSISPDRKPETVIEDSAVEPAKLSAYVRRIRQICAAHDTQVAIYGHASVGLIHARPLLNLKDPDDLRKMRAIAEAVKDLVLEFGGSLSGEHGDGLLRSEFNRELFGHTLYEAFREIKRTFDPHGVLNTGKIVDAQPLDINLRYGANYRTTIPFTTHYRFADTGGLAGAVELCNGNALCRKPSGGTMCPSYMVTRDEEHSTRGRANALRMVFSGALPISELTSQRMHDVMDLCLECKGCTTECPSRVNMTRIKSEWQAAYYREHGIPLRAWLFGNIHTLSKLGSALAPLSNWLLNAPGSGLLSERLLGISRHRRLPTFARQTFVNWFRKRPRTAPSERTVVLFPDTFANYNEPEIGKAAVRVLETLGYEVIIPQRIVCCGRPMLSKGLLDQAKHQAQQQLEWLAPYAEAGLPIIGLEPSCLLTFRDEYPDLIDDPRTEALAKHTFLLDEFLASELRAGRLTLPEATQQQAKNYLLHGHCHQKALASTSATLELLRNLLGATATEVDSGCCGMAGSFGYEAEHYDISQRIGERALFPAVRAQPADTDIVAMGTSCRHQIADGTQRRAKHIAEVLAEALT